VKDAFLAFSAEVTAFTTFELRGTGMADAYLAAVIDVVGEATVQQLLSAWDGVRQSGPAMEEHLRREIFGDEKLGPIARNIVKLWYIGIWYQLPYTWTQSFGALENDVTFTVSPAAYTEGLLWPAIGAHPPGAKAPGYGSWATPPEIPAIP
jgi:hypothetical protein